MTTYIESCFLRQPSVKTFCYLVADYDYYIKMYMMFMIMFLIVILIIMTKFTMIRIVAITIIIIILQLLLSRSTDSYHDRPWSTIIAQRAWTGFGKRLWNILKCYKGSFGLSFEGGEWPKGKSANVFSKWIFWEFGGMRSLVTVFRGFPCCEQLDVIIQI